MAAMTDALSDGGGSSTGDDCSAAAPVRAAASSSASRGSAAICGVEFGLLVCVQFTERSQGDEIIDSIVHTTPPSLPLSRCKPPRTRPLTVPSGRPSWSAMSEWLYPSMNASWMIWRWSVGSSASALSHPSGIERGDDGVVGAILDVGPSLPELFDAVALRLFGSHAVDGSPPGDRDRPRRTTPRVGSNRAADGPQFDEDLLGDLLRHRRVAQDPLDRSEDQRCDARRTDRRTRPGRRVARGRTVPTGRAVES